MSFEQPEFDLLAAFKHRFGFDENNDDALLETRVLKGAQHVYNNAIDVFVDRQGTQDAAAIVWSLMQKKGYSRSSWSKHELHPSVDLLGEEATARFIFTMDLLNFCFWSESHDSEKGFTIEWQDKKWTGYNALVAALQRALDEGLDITTPDFWQNEEDCNLDTLKHVFRSETEEGIPMLEQRLQCLREAGTILYEKYDCDIIKLIKGADKSAAKLVNNLAHRLPCFRDELKWEDEKVRFLKRAQIFVADLWACFDGKGLGEFHDIDMLTAFADYRIPQMLHTLGCLYYSPPLDSRIRRQLPIEAGHDWEVQLRGNNRYIFDP